jgi:hypothetical protein
MDKIQNASDRSWFRRRQAFSRARDRDRQD